MIMMMIILIIVIMMIILITFFIMMNIYITIGINNCLKFFLSSSLLLLSPLLFFLCVTGLGCKLPFLLLMNPMEAIVCIGSHRQQLRKHKLSQCGCLIKNWNNNNGNNSDHGDEYGAVLMCEDEESAIMINTKPMGMNKVLQETQWISMFSETCNCDSRGW